MSAHSPGPWSVEFPSEFPWGHRITASDTSVVIEDYAIACSSEQKTREDNLAAVGFPWRERPKVIEMLETQKANASLIAAAPELLEALKLMDKYIASLVEAHVCGNSISDVIVAHKGVVTTARAAISKAVGV